MDLLGKILEVFNEYSAAIQAFAAILNLIIIGILTIKGYSLQKRLITTEQFYKLQEETILCINSINNNIAYFESKANLNSSYLRQLFDMCAGGDDEAIAKYSLERFNKVVSDLKNIKKLLDDFSLNLISNNYNEQELKNNFKKLVHIRYCILNNSPSESFESSMYGAESHWVEEEQMFESAITETQNLIEKIESAIKALN